MTENSLLPLKIPTWYINCNHHLTWKGSSRKTLFQSIFMPVINDYTTEENPNSLQASNHPFTNQEKETNWNLTQRSENYQTTSPELITMATVFIMLQHVNTGSTTDLFKHLHPSKYDGHWLKQGQPIKILLWTGYRSVHAFGRATGNIS